MLVWLLNFHYDESIDTFKSPRPQSSTRVQALYCVMLHHTTRLCHTVCELAQALPSQSLAQISYCPCCPAAASETPVIPFFNNTKGTLSISHRARILYPLQLNIDYTLEPTHLINNLYRSRFENLSLHLSRSSSLPTLFLHPHSTVFSCNSGMKYLTNLLIPAGVSILAALFLGFIHLSHARKVSPTAREPPVARSIIPLFGHMIGYIRHGKQYIEMVR